MVPYVGTYTLLISIGTDIVCMTDQFVSPVFDMFYFLYRHKQTIQTKKLLSLAGKLDFFTFSFIEIVDFFKLKNFLNVNKSFQTQAFFVNFHFVKEIRHAVMENEYGTAAKLKVVEVGGFKKFCNLARLQRVWFKPG